MFNIHLLNTKLTVDELSVIYKGARSYTKGAEFVRKLPLYTVAICPFCTQENVEHLYIYGPSTWPSTGSPSQYVGMFGRKGFAFHCEHFVLAQNFLKYIDVKQDSIKFIPSEPYVYGYLLEQNMAQAVIHALPVCEYIDNRYVPVHTLFMMTYFSETAEEVYQSIGHTAIERMPAPESSTWLIVPRIYKNEDHWKNLSLWVERGLLYWVDASQAKAAKDGLSRLRTKDVENFPYKNLKNWYD